MYSIKTLIALNLGVPTTLEHSLHIIKYQEWAKTPHQNMKF